MIMGPERTHQSLRFGSEHGNSPATMLSSETWVLLLDVVRTAYEIPMGWGSPWTLPPETGKTLEVRP